jgi:sterol desaturase/sphingolipid hydroxylase (fatty acid hydroxylase superfamily)
MSISTNIFQILQSPEAKSGTKVGLKLILWTLGLTMVLELLSLKAVRAFRKEVPDGKHIYSKALILNVTNAFLIGLPAYIFASVAVCYTTEDSLEKLSPLENILQILWVLLTHGACYYHVHKMFHTYPVLYQNFHKFHHLFHTHIPPSAANAVELQEYLVAYILPFLIAISLRATNSRNLAIATFILSTTNLLVHTTSLENVYDFGYFIVNTKNHLDHHRKLNINFASPIFNVDHLIKYTSGKRRSEQKKT